MPRQSRGNAGWVGASLAVALAGSVKVAPASAQGVPEGQAVYRTSCASCHGARLQGGAHGPALTGVSFTSVWGDRSADELFTFVRAEMPPGAGG